MAWRELDLSGSGYGQAAGSGEEDDEFIDFKNCKEFLDKLRPCNFSRMTWFVLTVKMLHRPTHRRTLFNTIYAACLIVVLINVKNLPLKFERASCH